MTYITTNHYYKKRIGSQQTINEHKLNYDGAVASFRRRQTQQRREKRKIVAIQRIDFNDGTNFERSMAFLHRSFCPLHTSQHIDKTF